MAYRFDMFDNDIFSIHLISDMDLETDMGVSQYVYTNSKCFKLCIN